jgi:D-hydroxyproline dehydrogenase subunit gamma
MYRLRPEGSPASLIVVVEDRLVRVPAGASAAAAVLAAGLRHIGATPVKGSARAPYCMMGVCYECLAEIDGVANQQSCMVEVRAGMRVRRQTPRRRLNPVSHR